LLVCATPPARSEPTISISIKIFVLILVTAPQGDFHQKQEQALF
jgi:hypothetical protein